MGIVQRVSPETEADRYRKTLEKIENFIQKTDVSECPYKDYDCNNCDDDCECVIKVKKIILNIINKVKGGEDE